MKNIALMNTAIFSFNQGDYIIMESIKRELSYLLNHSFVVEIPTHSPMFHLSELGVRKKNSFYEKLQGIDYKFVCGTNLLHHNMKYAKTTWNINIWDSKVFGDMVLIGVGTDPKDEKVNKYTEKLYKNALSSQFIHSARDERTKQFLEAMGYEAINTGCATLWGLTAEHCEKIPRVKSDTVIFTLTDYAVDSQRDKQLVDILKTNYKNIFFWIQGYDDKKYLETLTDTREIKYINPLLENYSRFLEQNECDFVGTRLHAGIKAMQMHRRSIIIGVDNRARDMAKSYGFAYLERRDIKLLEEKIQDTFTTNININQSGINRFLSQFTVD